MLERMIVTLELAPGTVVTEGLLVERAGLGRTPVREAIQRLAWEGLLEVRPRSGIAVAPLNASDWSRVIEARRGVELVLARSAATTLPPDGGSAFRKAATAIQSAVMTRDAAGFLDADKSLDEAMAAATDNQFAVRVAAPLQTHSRRFWYRYRRDLGLPESAERHVHVIRAILNRDPISAELEMDRLMMMLAADARRAAGGCG
ncbi:MAG: GntR family transcriptional regulator [Rhizobiaceae bacterium]|nr:GntR family transcriptional regulator [Rhizobiaceae bacterium]MCV0407334.1 GntR family transcriptional regulator [Rhizobiaceae bacterium]